jgi:hypothetical protein
VLEGDSISKGWGRFATMILRNGRAPMLTIRAEPQTSPTLVSVSPH